MPKIRPARNASPQPVGSVTRRSCAGGMSMACAVGVDLRALRAAGGDVGLDLAGDGLLVPAGALLQQVGLVVVDGDVVGLFDEVAQLLAVEQRHRLAGIEDEGDAAPRRIPARSAACPRGRPGLTMPKVTPGTSLHVVLVAAHHRARVEGGDLVVVEVGGDERLRGEQLVDHLDVVEGDAVLVEPLAVRAEVLARRWPSGSGRRPAA